MLTRPQFLSRIQFDNHCSNLRIPSMGGSRKLKLQRQLLKESILAWLVLLIFFYFHPKLTSVTGRNWDQSIYSHARSSYSSCFDRKNEGRCQTLGRTHRAARCCLSFDGFQREQMASDCNRCFQKKGTFDSSVIPYV